jgi:hypothetical protein
MPQDDFDYGEEEPQKKGFSLFTKKDKGDMIDPRSRKMPEPMSDDLMKLLGGAYKGPEDRNMAMDYVGNSYVPISESYRPISETFKKNDYQTPKWEEFTYESPGYESASGVLFGEQGKAWEDSPVFKRSGIGLWDEAEKSPVFTKTGMSDLLFGNEGKTPMVTGQIPTMPMSAPAGATIPYQRVSPITQFAPSPVVIGQPQMVTPPQFPPMPTMPTQIIPPQYVPSGQPIQYKRPVGRPRLNKPKLPKRPVGRPRKVVETTQMVEQ